MATKRVVDLVFLVDVTGSMNPCIDGLKKSIDAFFSHLTDETGNVLAIRDWRAKVVGFRDVAFDKEHWFVDNPFVTTAEAIRAQLQGLEAKGGGDEPESLLDALLTIADMGEAGIQEGDCTKLWRPRNQASRAVMVFTDATYHPEAMLAKYEGCNCEDVARKMMEQRIILEIITPVAPSDATVSQERFEKGYLDLTKADRAEYCQLISEQGETFAFSDIPEKMTVFTSFMEQLAKTISQTVDVPEL